MTIGRREFLAAAGTAPVLATPAPARPVAIAKFDSYNAGLSATLDQVLGIYPKVRNRTVTINLSHSGSPVNSFQRKSPALAPGIAQKRGLGAAHLHAIPILGIPIDEARFAFRKA